MIKVLAQLANGGELVETRFGIQYRHCGMLFYGDGCQVCGLTGFTQSDQTPAPAYAVETPVSEQAAETAAPDSTDLMDAGDEKLEVDNHDPADPSEAEQAALLLTEQLKQVAEQDREAEALVASTTATPKGSKAAKNATKA